MMHLGFGSTIISFKRGAIPHVVYRSHAKHLWYVMVNNDSRTSRIDTYGNVDGELENGVMTFESQPNRDQTISVRDDRREVPNGGQVLYLD